jgi:uncharacterized protein YndB with AHSA1/START domain
MTDTRQLTTDYEKTMRVNAPADALFDAITATSGLAAWWTDVAGSGDAGGELRFFFDPPQPCVMRVDQATRPTSVQWTVTSCDFLTDWVGTRPTFTITPIDGDACDLHFRHIGLTSQLDCIEDCTQGWNFFLQSLRQFAEVGRGTPRGTDAERARRR